jgi:hypothetical protein
MQNFLAVVYTAGRTGSHLIIRNLFAKYHLKIRSDQESNFTDGIVHTHNPLYRPPSNNFIAIVSQRKNLFESILSTELAKVTNEFTDYTNKTIQPYSIDINKFKNCYFYQKSFYRAINRTGFSKVVDVFYEDLISSSDSLSEFGITVDLSIGKSPYNYYDLITNIDELKDLYNQLESSWGFIYNQLEQKEITDLEIEQFKLIVKKDLDDIRINFNGNRP